MSIVHRLQQKTDALLQRVAAHEAYRLIFSPETEEALLLAVLRQLLLRVSCYGDHVTASVFTALGRWPRNKPHLLRPLLEQVLDEVSHPGMALKDYLRMGGDDRQARSQRMTPAAFAVAATCRALAERESPFAYLGFVALLEFTTPILTERVRDVLRARRAERSSQFIALHAVEDHEHASLIQRQIEATVDGFPDAAEAIEFGFDCFAQVYPVPIWDEALTQARLEVHQPAGA
jgi:hypothetical protein